MKKLTLSILFAGFTLSILAQDSSAVKIRRHELGIDVTGFVQQFFFLNVTQYPVGYNPYYMLTYRYHLPKGNIRAAVAGSMYQSDIDPLFATDVHSYSKAGYSAKLRIGYERYTELGKRWQTFYGIDFRPEYSYDRNDVNYYGNGYASGYEAKNLTMGIAPVLGIRFRLNNRISLSTETNFSINWTKSDSRRYYNSIDASLYPPIADDMVQHTKAIYSSYSQPLSILFTFDL